MFFLGFGSAWAELGGTDLGPVPPVAELIWGSVPPGPEEQSIITCDGGRIRTSKSRGWKELVESFQMTPDFVSKFDFYLKL